MALKDFKTRAGKYSPGYGVVLELTEDLPRRYDEKVYGSGDQKGLTLEGTVVNLFGDEVIQGWVPKFKERVRVTVRPTDSRRTIFDDLSKTNEGRRFFLEGVSGNTDSLEARWAHGAGVNRMIELVEIVGAPHVVFENPIKNNGPKNGFLRLNLDGSPTTYDERLADGTYVERDIPYDVVVERLDQALKADLTFRVGQRALFPSLAKVVGGQEELEGALTNFRSNGMTHCVVRTFVPGTQEISQVDIQLLSWPQDQLPKGEFKGANYDMPALSETKRFAALRDGDAEAVMEVIPGFILNLVGNPSDSSKSVRHKFAQDIVKGHSDKQKSMFATQAYGPGVAIRAVNEQGEKLGMTRLAVRIEGPQHRNLAAIPTANFTGIGVPDAQRPAESGADAPASE